MRLALRWLSAVVLLPGNVLAVVPSLILLGFRGSEWEHQLQLPPSPRFWLALGLGALGLTLAGWTASLFLRFGEGTPAPWDPPRRFVVRGPYRHLRNPMIGAVIVVLAAESLLLASWPLLAWGATFAVGNALYIPMVEERRLLSRFGAAYETYRSNVPRWLPRLRGWSPSPNSST